jgi:hypothetical protein
MRTVHETEALRPSDPIPKMDPAKASRLKLIIKKSQEGKGESQQSNGTVEANGVEAEANGWTSSYPSELGFTAEEEAHGSKEMFRLLRRQVHWAEEEAESLKKQCEFMEELRRKDWAEKEVLLGQVISNEADWYKRREEVLAGKANTQIANQMAAAGVLLPEQAQGQLQSPHLQPVVPPSEKIPAVALNAVQQT